MPQSGTDDEKEEYVNGDNTSSLYRNFERIKHCWPLEIQSFGLIFLEKI